MALGTFHSVMEMHLMRKIDEIRKALESDPLNQRPIFPILQKFLGFGCFFPEVLVASHAELHGRDTGNGGYVRIAMAKQTGYLQLTGMEFVAERHGLNVLCRTVSGPAGVQQSYDQRDASADKENDRRFPDGAPCKGCGCHHFTRCVPLPDCLEVSSFQLQEYVFFSL
jgi:hypothetical protein